MSEIPNELSENYKALAAERGTTVDRLAPEFDQYSPALAAWMRSQAITDPAEVPQERQAPERSEA